jgi:hypothetical protein
MLRDQALYAMAWIVAKRALVCLVPPLCIIVLVSWTPAACARKLLHIAWAVVTKAQWFDPSYALQMQRA